MVLLLTLATPRRTAVGLGFLRLDCSTAGCGERAPVARGGGLDLTRDTLVGCEWPCVSLRWLQRWGAARARMVRWL